MWGLTHLGKQRTRVRRVLRTAHVDDVAGQSRGQRAYEAAGRLGAHDLRPDGEGNQRVQMARAISASRWRGQSAPNNHSCPFMAPSTDGTQRRTTALNGTRFQSNGNQRTCSRMASTSAQSFCGKAESASTSGGCARSSTNTSLYPPSCASGLNQLRPNSCELVISGHQWSSVVISGHQWSSVVISGHQWSSVVISRPNSCVATKTINCNQMKSIEIKGNQLHPFQSAHLRSSSSVATKTVAPLTNPSSFASCPKNSVVILPPKTAA